MNLLLLRAEECLPGAPARVVGARAREMVEAHGLVVGLRLTAGVLGGRLGHAEVRSITPEEVLLNLTLDRDAPSRRPIDLVVALPRPQTVKKVIQLSCQLGITELHLLRSERVVKSYLQSIQLSAGAIEHELQLGLEQAADTIPPLLRIHRAWSGFMREEWPRLVERSRLQLVADTRGTRSVAAVCSEVSLSDERVVLIIGPESGWVPAELEAFAAAGARVVTLGGRMLRVEHALTFLVAQCEAARVLTL